MNATSNIVSIGRLSCDVQASVTRVRAALERLGIAPTISINGIDHFDAAVADRLFPALADRDATAAGDVPTILQ